MLSPGVLRADPTPPNGAGGFSPSGTSKELFCRGDRDFTAFLSSTVDLSLDGTNEYFKDIFYRYPTSYCQYLDVYDLIKRINKVQDQIRTAFENCSDTTTLVYTYHKLEAELYYVRKVFDNGNVTPDNQMMQQMHDEFVTNDNYFSEDDMTKIYTLIKSKYAAKIAQGGLYSSCSQNTSWDDLVNKWNEFYDSAGGFGPALKEASDGISKHWDKLAQTAGDLKNWRIADLVKVKINGLDFKEGLKQILDELRRNSPGGIHIYDSLVAQQNSGNKVDEKVLAAKYQAEYEILYKETGDEYTKQILNKLDLLNAIITKTYVQQNKAIQCLKNTNKRQC